MVTTVLTVLEPTVVNGMMVVIFVGKRRSRSLSLKDGGSRGEIDRTYE